MQIKRNVPIEFTGKHMLFLMIAFFGVIITVNFTMAVLATNSWTGLVVKNSYVASQEFNAELAKAKLQHEAGLHSDLAYRDGTLIFILKNNGGQELSVSGLKAKIGRPAFEQLDRDLSFASGADNIYVLSVQLAPGIWHLEITGQAGQRDYRRDVRLHVDQSGNGRLE